MFTGTETDLPRPMSSDSSSTVAIAIGLGVGLLVLLTVVILFGWGFYYIRTWKRKNGERDKVEVKLQVLNSSPRQELKANQGSVPSLSEVVCKDLHTRILAIFSSVELEDYLSIPIGFMNTSV